MERNTERTSTTPAGGGGTINRGSRSGCTGDLLTGDLLTPLTSVPHNKVHICYSTTWNTDTSTVTHTPAASGPMARQHVPARHFLSGLEQEAPVWLWRRRQRGHGSERRAGGGICYDTSSSRDVGGSLWRMLGSGNRRRVRALRRSGILRAGSGSSPQASGKDRTGAI